MIQKVNRPAHLTLVNTKRTENDPGSSSGSGLFYDGGGQKQPEPEKKDKSTTLIDEEKPAKPGLTSHTVAECEKAGMTEVVKELFELRKGNEPSEHNRPGLAVKYVNDASPAKGLLLNRKAE